MASSLEIDSLRQDVLQISPFSELKNYEKIRILGSGGFGKVYLVRYKKNSTNSRKSVTNPSDNDMQEDEFALKLQFFDGGPILNRREANIMRRLVNLEVYLFYYNI